MLNSESLQEKIFQIKDALRIIDLEANKSRLQKTEKLCQLLISYNSHTNLVADPSPEILVERHILDSLSLLEFWPISGIPMSDNKKNHPVRTIDLGSGAGFPGLILAIWIDSLEMTLADSNGKKTRFLNECVDALELNERVRVVTDRLENLGRDPRHRHGYDFVTSRALGHLCLSAELGLPLLARGGVAAFYKTARQAELETKALEAMLEALGADRPTILKPKIQMGSSEHVIVQIVKRGKGADSFPRNWKAIKKHLEKLKG